MKCSLPFRFKFTHVNFIQFNKKLIINIISTFLVNITLTQSKALQDLSFPYNLMQAHEHIHMCIHTRAWIIVMFSKI